MGECFTAKPVGLSSTIKIFLESLCVELRMDSHHGLKRDLIIFTFVFLHLVQAQDQEGFISLDCGLPPNQSPYTEPTTKLNFTSDAKFIQTGTQGRISNPWGFTYQQYNFLRSFPDGTRNCYDLSVKQGINYLIRAGFAYGNYDGRNIFPRFDLYIGPNLWTTVAVNDIFSRFSETDFEIIHKAKTNSVQICLVKTGTTTPFISTLELRPLRNDAYSTQPGSLQLISRGHYIEDYSPIVRYPDDVYDRQWSHRYFDNAVVQINTTQSVNTSTPFVIPEVIARSVAIPKNASESLQFSEISTNPSDNIVIYLHFAEIQNLQANDTREFNILWNLNITNSAYRPKKLQIETIFNTSPNKCDSQFCDMELVRTPKSTRPPLISAFESYNVLEFPYSETDSADVAAVQNIKAAYKLNIISWQGDPCLPKQWKWDGVECNYTTNQFNPPRIISLDLSSTNLSGIIVPGFQNLTQLQKLDLSHNNLSGSVPEFLATMKSLSIINLSWNKLNGRVPRALRDRKKHGLQLLIDGNKNVCLDDFCKIKNKSILIPVGASIAGLILIVLLLVLFLVFKRKRPQKARKNPPFKSSILTKKKRFTYPEVEAMTNNFERVIGEGGFSTVYHGSLSDTEKVAVKLLSQSPTQGYKQFKEEVELLLRVHHVNLVSLVGYCFEEDHLALVYEYTTNGDLLQHLSGECGGSPLSWENRLNIATDIAQGLEYLHTGCRPPMVHRDVKTTNILIDENFQAKLVDFGLCRTFPIGNETHLTTVVAGTPGYLDPEYNQTSWLTEKSDVYSFGIVLLEIITSQSVIDQNREKPHIAEWVGYMLTQGGIENIVDPSLSGDYDSSSIWKFLELAVACVNPSSMGRPNMSHVVNELKECLVSENSRKGGTTEVDSKSSFEPSIQFAAGVTPVPR